MVCSQFCLLVYVIIFDKPSVLRSITCSLSCQPIQGILFSLKAIESPFGSFCFTPAGKNFQFRTYRSCDICVPWLQKFCKHNYLYKGGSPCQVKAASSLHIYHETKHVHYNFYFFLHIWKNYTCNQLNFHINRTTWSKSVVMLVQHILDCWSPTFKTNQTFITRNLLFWDIMLLKLLTKMLNNCLNLL